MRENVRCFAIYKSRFTLECERSAKWELANRMRIDNCKVERVDSPETQTVPSALMSRPLSVGSN